MLEWKDKNKETPNRNKYNVCGNIRIHLGIYVKFKNGKKKRVLYRFSPKTGSEFLQIINGKYKLINDDITHWAYINEPNETK